VCNATWAKRTSWMSPGTPYSFHSRIPRLHSCRDSCCRCSSARGVAPSHMRKEHCRVGYSRPPSVVPSPPSYSVALALLRHSALLAEVELPEEVPSTPCRNFHQQVFPLRAHTVIGVWTIPSHEEGIAQFWIFHDPRSFITRLCFIFATHVLTSGDASEEGISDMEGHKLSSCS